LPHEGDAASGVRQFRSRRRAASGAIGATSCGQQREGGTEIAARRVEGVASWRPWRQNGAMPSVQIKDVPPETHAVLRRRAAEAGQSLQEYLRARLVEEAGRPTVDEVLNRAGGRAGGSLSLDAAAAAVREDRARR
jgi:hypothetical protein